MSTQPYRARRLLPLARRSPARQDIESVHRSVAVLALAIAGAGHAQSSPSVALVVGSAAISETGGATTADFTLSANAMLAILLCVDPPPPPPPPPSNLSLRSSRSCISGGSCGIGGKVG